MEKTKGRRVWQIVISILAAIALWVYVDSQVNTDCTMNVKGVPVEFSGEDTTLAEKGLMILSGYDTTIDLKLEGPRRVLWQMDTDKIRLVIDTSVITSTGVQSLSYTPVYPDNVQRSSVSVKSASAYTVTVTVGELYTKEIPIRCEVTGTTADGYFTGDLEMDTDTLTLRAQREDLLNVSYAKVQIALNGATSTLVQTLEYTLYDYNDQPVENENIRSATKLVQVRLPVRTTKEVPLLLDMIGAPTGSDDSVQYEVTPSTVTLIGETGTLAAINSIVLDKVYAEDLGDYQTFSYDIEAPAGTKLADGTPEVATVVIIVRGAADAVLSVEDITCENVAEGFKAEAIGPLDVRVWGLTEDVETMTTDDLLVRVDLSSVMEAGTYELPAIITLRDREDVSVKGTYLVQVVVSERTSDSPEELNLTEGA